MVRGAVHGIALYRKAEDVPEQSGIASGNGSERLKIAGAGRLRVDQVPRKPGGNGIDPEFIGTGVDAQLVRPVGLCHSHMLGKCALEWFQVSDVIHSLLEGAD